MKVIFRVDASTAIGTGHVMRCLTLASALRERGVIAHFACREHSGSLSDLIAERGFVVARLPLETASDGAESSRASHTEWLGASWQQDVAQTRSVIQSLGVK